MSYRQISPCFDRILEKNLIFSGEYAGRRAIWRAGLRQNGTEALPDRCLIEGSVAAGLELAAIYPKHRSMAV